MKSRTRAVVIGGGITGISTLCHLTQAGWSDVVLLERDDLASGTAWHSAAQVTNFGTDQAMVSSPTPSGSTRNWRRIPTVRSTAAAATVKFDWPTPRRRCRDITISPRWRAAQTFISR